MVKELVVAVGGGDQGEVIGTVWAGVDAKDTAGPSVAVNGSIAAINMVRRTVHRSNDAMLTFFDPMQFFMPPPPPQKKDEEHKDQDHGTSDHASHYRTDIGPTRMRTASCAPRPGGRLASRAGEVDERIEEEIRPLHAYQGYSQDMAVRG